MDRVDERLSDRVSARLETWPSRLVPRNPTAALTEQRRVVW